MKAPYLIPAMAVTLALSACAENAVVTSANIGPISVANSPPEAMPGTCWGKNVSPAIVETITHKVLLQPAQISSDGRVQVPPIYKTEDVQHVAHPRKENWFEVPCEAQMTPEFIASVQRALEARGHYSGPITGEMDSRTRAAVRRYQRSEGFDSAILTVAAARNLGLIAVDRQPSNG